MQKLTVQVIEPLEAQKACHQLTTALPEWFGIYDQTSAMLR